jgi:hypothetical protein
MRCPSCGDEYEPGVLTCADCRVPLSSDGAPAPSPEDPDTRLGRFDAALESPMRRLLDGRGVVHQVRVHDDGIEVLVDARIRDELRAELVADWERLLGAVEDQDRARVRALADELAGWLDAPRGGHIDRHGRLVVDTADDDDADASRVVGPALLVGGAAVAFVGWSVLELEAVVVAGIAMILAGLFIPR